MVSWFKYSVCRTDSALVRQETGVKVRKELVKHAVKVLKGGGLSAISLDAKTVSGVRVDVIAYDKAGASVAVLCQAMVEPSWVRKRAALLHADYIDKVVLCIPENTTCPPIDGVEVWKANGTQVPKAIKVNGQLFDLVEKLRQDLSKAAGREISSDEVIGRMYERFTSEEPLQDSKSKR